MVRAHGFEFFEDLLRRKDLVRSVGGHLLAGRRLTARVLVGGPGAELRLRKRVGRRGLDGVDGLGWFGSGVLSSGEDELSRRSLVRGAHEQVVEVKPGEQMEEDLT